VVAANKTCTVGFISLILFNPPIDSPLISSLSVIGVSVCPALIKNMSDGMNICSYRLTTCWLHIKGDDFSNKVGRYESLYIVARDTVTLIILSDIT
jgi:hypothetical protein